MSRPPDSDLMVRVQSGDHQAFAQIVDRYKDPMVGYLCRLTGSRDRAEDLAQETFLKLYLHAPDYTENGHLRAYLFRIATNLVRSEVRKDRRRKMAFGFTGTGARGDEPETSAWNVETRSRWVNGHAVPSSATATPPGAVADGGIPSPHAGVLRAEIQRELTSALASLPLSFRVPVVLHDIEDWTYEEIARATGEKTGTIKSRINRGRRKLRAQLEPTLHGVTT